MTAIERRVKRLEREIAEAKARKSPFRAYLVDETETIEGSYPTVEAIGETRDQDVAICLTFVEPEGGNRE